MAEVAAQKQLSAQEQLRRTRRKGSYHLVASRNKLPHPDDLEDEEEDDLLFKFLTSIQPSSLISADRQLQIQETKKLLLRDLAASQGDVTTPGFMSALGQLEMLYDPSTFDARKRPPKPPSSNFSRRSSGSRQLKKGASNKPALEGMWMALSKPKFDGCLGTNSERHLLYTLGRMSFDMFRPGNLVCSIQGTFNAVHVIDGAHQVATKNIPKRLGAEVRDGANVLRKYDVVTAFTIEPKNEKFGKKSPNNIAEQPLEGLMTTYGYVLPNPNIPNRLSVWFTGGSIEVNAELERWKKVFNQHTMRKRNWKEKAIVFGAKLLMGAAPSEAMEADGKMSYQLRRPVGAHDRFYIDVLYLDETLRIARANTGAIFVFVRVPYFPDE